MSCGRYARDQVASGSARDTLLRTVLGWMWKIRMSCMECCRYAREIAVLKTRLAEKDAQLMGGFGALSNMQFGRAGGGLPDPEAIAATLPEQVSLHMISIIGGQSRQLQLCTDSMHTCTLDGLYPPPPMYPPTHLWTLRHIAWHLKKTQ